jgi:predicted nucleic acid-binding protein
VRILLDSDVLIDHLRGSEPAGAALRNARQRGDRISASVLSKVEILSGVRKAEERKTRRVLDQLEWLEVTDEIAEQAGAFGARYLRSHRHIETTDYVVAATAELVGAALWTRNLKHFPMFPRLREPYAV